MSAPLLLVIDKSSPVPIYHQLAQALEKAIHSGALPPGTKLESETKLAARLQITRPTVRKALNQLVARGLVVHPGRTGAYVATGEPVISCPPAPPRFHNRKPDLPHDAKAE